ncbi:MAG: Hsp20/alpha crystallin family protein [Oscillospiraceae bacterium]
MFDMVPFTARYASPRTWDPFQEFFGTVVRSAATDIRETNEAFQIETELPGYDKSEISVSVKEGVLSIKAEHSGEKSSDDGYLRRERTWETVERSFEVSGVDTGAISAAYTNGILTVTLPKLPEVIPEQHQIEIV